MKTLQSRPKHGGQGSPFNWRWAAVLALLACLITAGSAKAAGTLTVSMAPLSQAIPVDMSAEGDLDWAHYGRFFNADYDHKAGVAERIGKPTQTGTFANFGGAAALCSWVDGTVDQAVAGTATGSYIYPAGSAYQWNIPASTGPVVLHLYVSTYQGGGDLTFTLSDGSAPAVTMNVGTNIARRVTVTFAANSAGQTLTVDYAVSPGAGNNIALMGATLSSAEALPLSVPTPQLSSGSALAAGSTFTALVKPTGVAANGATAFAYQWQVDNGGGYLDIAGGTNQALSATAGSAGSYNYRVAVTNSVLGTAATSAPVALTVTTPTGTLSAIRDTLPELSPTPLDVNLTAEGSIDWGHWGLVSPTDYDYKNGVIGNFTQIGADLPVPFTSGVSFSWTDATTANNPVAETTSGVGLPTGNGFELNIPAATTNRLVHIYVGVNNAYLNVTATLSDNTAPLFTDNPTITKGTLRYSIAFGAASTGKTLKVRLTETARAANNGSFSLLSAALQSVPPLSVSALVVDPGTAVLVNQPMIVSIAPLEPQGVGPFTYVWQRDTGAGYANLPDTGRSASFLAGSTPGSESCRVIITGSQGSITSAPVVLTRTEATGVVKLLTVDLSPAGPNLTQEGSLDWSHWGFSASTDFDQKAIGGIPVNLIGNFIPYGPGTSLSRFGSGVTYRWYDGTPNLAATNNGAVYRFPAGNGFELNVAAAQTNRLLHVYLGTYQAVAHVEAYLSDNSAIKLVDESLPWGGNGKFNIQFAAGSPGQTLVFRVWFNSGGNVTFGAASLEGMPALVAGTPTIGPASSVPAGSSILLQLQGANGVPLLKYQWQVDSGSGYAAVSGATNANVTTSAGNTLGSRNYRVVVSDITGSVTSAPVALTVTAATSSLAGIRTGSALAPLVNLSAEGELDWAHYSTAVVDQKDPLAGLISSYSPVGAWTTPNGYGGGILYSWTNGTPTPEATANGSGIYIPGAGNGFALEVPAAASERVFTVYCGVYQATMHMEAMMSDNSAPIFIDESLFNGGGTTDARYSFRYSSPNPGAVLKVRYWDLAGANVTLQAATLKNYVPVTPGTVQVQPVSSGQLQLTWAAGTLQEAPTVNGPWTANSATSPYMFTPTGAQKYFRTVQAPF